jgi:serine protein kinase
VQEALRDLLTVVKEEYEDIIKNEVQRAISADEERSAAVRQLHRQRQGVHAEGEGQEPYTGRDEEPDERLMRSIEEKIDIPERARTTSARRS